MNPANNDTNQKNTEQEQSQMTDQIKNLTLNTGAKDYVPKKKEVNKDQKFQFNLEAKEYKPKQPSQTDYENPYTVKTTDEEENEELEDEELDMIVNDLVENDAYEEFEEEESDDEKWFPNFANCECCKGYIYKCKGSACTNMGVCYCKMKDECDEEN